MKRLADFYFWTACIGLLGLMTLCCGCTTAVAESKPVFGGTLKKEKSVTTTSPGGVIQSTIESTTFEPPNNPETESRVEVDSDGKFSGSFGSAFKPVITIPPAPDYTKYYALAGGFILFGAGIWLSATSWPQLGTRLAIGGAVIIVISLTVGQYAWLYALGVAGLVGYVVWEKYAAYKKGLHQPVPEAI